MLQLEGECEEGFVLLREILYSLHLLLYAALEMARLLMER